MTTYKCFECDKDDPCKLKFDFGDPKQPTKCPFNNVSNWKKIIVKEEVQVGS